MNDNHIADAKRLIKELRGQSATFDGEEWAGGAAAASGDDIEEAREILTNLISNIETEGPYSAEATITFIQQALLCLAKSDWPDDAAAGASERADAEKDAALGAYVRRLHGMLGRQVEAFYDNVDAAILAAKEKKS